jgi:hypothetical protein
MNEWERQPPVEWICSDPACGTLGPRLNDCEILTDVSAGRRKILPFMTGARRAPKTPTDRGLPLNPLRWSAPSRLPV